MTLFLFAKQIIDMLYQYRWLDYAMVIFAVLLLLYQFALVRPHLRSWFTRMDGIVLGLGGLLTVGLIRGSHGTLVYGKVMSALLLYFVGRIYYDRIKECTGALVAASYIVVYLNLGARIAEFGSGLLRVTNAEGDFYYYDTAMAFAMILAMVFIGMFGKNSLKKLITVFAVCPYMVFWSDAGIQKVLMLAIYGIMAVYVIELVFGKRKLMNLLLTVMVAGLLGVVALVHLPLIRIPGTEGILSLLDNPILSARRMYARYPVWTEAMEQLTAGGGADLWLGLGITEEYRIQSLYVKTLYCLGITGILTMLALIGGIVYYVVKVEDRKTFYLTIMLAVLLLGSGVAVNSMETVQMSWFPMLFAGMVVSSVELEEYV